MDDLLLVNFGGPRHLEEIEPFLRELLCDQDVIRTPFPPFLHNWIFGRVATKRSVAVRADYEKIGGASPIYFDTEAIANALAKLLNCRVLTFHRYLPATHAASFAAIQQHTRLCALPLFPQFCSATTGSAIRFLSRSQQIRWIHSYANHPAFLNAYQKRIRTFLHEHHLQEEETALLFSAHGVPRSFIASGDCYEKECNASFQGVMRFFPKALGKLSYQSKFGKGEWLRPYTNEICQTSAAWAKGKKQIVIVPITFTSDHIETLFEIEELYLPLIRAQSIDAYRCPALNLEPYWIEALATIATSCG